MYVHLMYIITYYVCVVNQFPVHHYLFLLMEQSIVHWEMMEFLPMKTLVVSHVTLVMT